MNKYLYRRLVDGGKFQKCQVNQFLSLLNKNFNKSLEIGCGKGFFSYVAAKMGKINESNGCDIFNDFQIKEIEEYAKNVEYKNIQSNSVPYGDNAFDLVFSMDVIEHVENDEMFVREHLRVCKKNGRGDNRYAKLFQDNQFINVFIGKIKISSGYGK